jgi:O-succinylbenzoate synthase
VSVEGAQVHAALAGLALHPFVLPMAVRFRRTDVRRGVLVEGPAGWGEFSPFDEYGPDVTRSWAASAIAAATEAAPAALRAEIAVNVTVPAEAPADAFARVVASGATTAKVKVAEPGQSLDDDLARVAAVRDALGVSGAIRVDANGAWDLATATLVVPRLASAAGGLEYVEQPCASLEEMAALRRRVAVPLAADESVRTAADPRRVALAGAADVDRGAARQQQPRQAAQAGLQAAHGPDRARARLGGRIGHRLIAVPSAPFSRRRVAVARLARPSGRAGPRRRCGSSRCRGRGRGARGCSGPRSAARCSR